MYFYAMEYCSPLKRKKILPFAIAWMENIMLSAMSARERQIPYDFTHRWKIEEPIGLR